MVNKYSNNSVFIAALFCIILFYSGLITLKDRDSFTTFLPQNEIKGLSGQLISSPIKCSNEKYYSSKIYVNKVVSSKGIKADSFGKITIFIPCSMIEAFYPGKLYSDFKSTKNDEAFLWETGGIYLVQGYFSNGNFYVSSCINSYFPQTFFGTLDKIRALFRLQFKRLMFSWGDAGGLLLALLCGAKEYTNTNIANSFKNAGLSHILALSGMHLSMFSGIALFIGGKIGKKKLTFIIRVIALILFVWFAGFSPSLLRAFICSFLMIIAALANVSKPDMLIILCFSFLMQTIISPGDIYNTGFILSYSALAGILLTNKFFEKFYIRFLPKTLALSVSSSTGAQIFTAPISLKIFGTFSPIGIIATTVVSPIITIFIYAGLSLILLSLIFPFLSVPSGIFINFLYTIIKFLVNIFSKAFIWRIN